MYYTRANDNFHLSRLSSIGTGRHNYGSSRGCRKMQVKVVDFFTKFQKQFFVFPLHSSRLVTKLVNQPVRNKQTVEAKLEAGRRGSEPPAALKGVFFLFLVHLRKSTE